jgi:hypothetical protein
MARVFVERWFSPEEGDETELVVWFDEETAYYEVAAGEVTVYRSGEFSSVLKWLLGMADDEEREPS